MRPIILLLPLVTLAAAPCAAQGILLPVQCPGECPAGLLDVESVRIFANARPGHVVTTVNHTIRNASEETLDGAFFFPLPPDAAVTSVAVYQNNQVVQYDEWSRPEESRLILQGLARERRIPGLGEYARTGVVHVSVRDIPANGSRHLRIVYTQVPHVDGDRVVYRYPLSAGLAAAPAGHLTLGVEVKTAAGFDDLRSPSHAVEVEWGMEPGPCPPEARCGSMGVPSRRVKVVRLQSGREDRRRDFELVYVPSPGAAGATPPP